MSQYQGVSTTTFTEPWLRDTLEITLYVYLMVNRDMAGVVPVNRRMVAASCRTRPGLITKKLEYFESIEKIVNAMDSTHVWLRAGINHTLYKGKFSKNQMDSVVKCLLKWNNSSAFRNKWVSNGNNLAPTRNNYDPSVADLQTNGNNFATTIAQLYATKYKIEIPIPTQSETLSAKSDIQSDIQTQSEAETDSKRQSATALMTALVELWKKKFPELAQWRGITSTRKRHLQARLKEHPDLAFWEELFTKAKESAFLMGDRPARDGNSKPFKMTLDFLIQNDHNIVKVLEGKYDDQAEGETEGEKFAREYREDHPDEFR